MNPQSNDIILDTNPNQAITTLKKITCLECKNEVDLSDKIYKAGDVVECPFCGIEYKVVNVTETGEYELELLQEEK